MRKHVEIEEKDLTGTDQIISVVYNGIEPKVDREGTRCFGMSDPTTWFEFRARLADPQNKKPQRMSGGFQLKAKYSPEITIWFGNNHHRVTFEMELDLSKLIGQFLIDPITLLGLAMDVEDIPGAVAALATTMFATVAQLEVKKAEGRNVLLILTLPGEHKAERVIPFGELADVLNLPE